MQHADHFTRILNEKESFRREKFLETRPENVSEDTDGNIGNLDQNPDNDLAEASSDESKIEKNSNSQVEIN